MIPFLRLGIEVPRTKFPFRIMRSTLFLFSQLVLFLCRCRVHFLHFEMLHFVSPLFPLFKVFSIKFAFISYTFISNGALIPDLGSASDWLNQISHAAQPIRSTDPCQKPKMYWPTLKHLHYAQLPRGTKKTRQGTVTDMSTGISSFSAMKNDTYNNIVVRKVVKMYPFSLTLCFEGAFF